MKAVKIKSDRFANFVKKHEPSLDLTRILVKGEGKIRVYELERQLIAKGCKTPFERLRTEFEGSGLKEYHVRYREEDFKQAEPKKVELNLPKSMFKKRSFKVDDSPLNKFRSILNRITWSNISEMVKNILDIEVPTVAEIEEMAEILYFKYVYEKVFARVYMNIIPRLKDCFVSAEERREGRVKRTAFFSRFITICLKGTKLPRQWILCTAGMTEDEIEDRICETQKVKEQVMGSIELIGGLYIEGFTSSKGVQKVFENLSRYERDEDVEAMCHLLNTVGVAFISKKDSKFLKTIVLSLKKAPCTTKRIEFMREAALENLIPKKLPDENRDTLEVCKALREIICDGRREAEAAERPAERPRVKAPVPETRADEAFRIYLNDPERTRFDIVEKKVEGTILELKHLREDYEFEDAVSFMLKEDDRLFVEVCAISAAIKSTCKIEDLAKFLKNVKPSKEAFSFIDKIIDDISIDYPLAKRNLAELTERYNE